MIDKTFFTSIRYFWRRQKVDFGNYKVVTPTEVSAIRLVPKNIVKPSYYQSGVPTGNIDRIEIKNADQIRKMRKSCSLASTILHKTGEHIKVGMTTDEIDGFVHELAVKNNAYPSPLYYKGFPKSVCTSVNNVACHGIPDYRHLQDGDIINVDITIYYDGYHGDCSKTFLVGKVDAKGVQLVKATEECLKEAIAVCKPGEHFNSIGHMIENKANSLGYTVIPSLIGHGIGKYFHGPPDIYHSRNHYPGIMKPGMTFTIEPALTQGSEDIEILEDGWTAVTVDHARAAQCEHTVLITDDGVDILTVPE